MKAKKIFLIIIAFSIFLTGCLPHESVENVALVNIVGYDYVDNDLVQGTISVRHFGRSKEEIPSEQFLSFTAKSMKEISSGLESKSPRPIRLGKLSLALYDERLVTEGISEIIDVLARDPHIGRDVYLGIVKGSAKEMIETKYSENETTARFLTGIVEQNERNNFPKTNLHKFLYAYYGDGIDGFLPLLKLEENEMKMDGIGVFKEDALVHEVPYSDVFTYKLLIENFNDGTQGIEIGGKTVVMDNIGSKVKYRLYGDRNNPKFSVNIKMKGMVSEISDLTAKDTYKLTDQLEKAFEHYHEEKGKRMIKQFQEKEVDPLGLGKVLKNRKGHFDKEAWEQQYPNVPVEVNVEVQIVETGISA
ncbi:Ger(x)C family spore germination protein [Thalassobacillus sp. B23F22_16]|uniref:Ger(x)C family spore germination protein n=1 Tax=Thalassobacillus sp. B23F22_16 TaxID=3459513 RepID=UPI00373FC132